MSKGRLSRKPNTSHPRARRGGRNSARPSVASNRPMLAAKPPDSLATKNNAKPNETPGTLKRAAPPHASSVRKKSVRMIEPPHVRLMPAQRAAGKLKWKLVDRRAPMSGAKFCAKRGGRNSDRNGRTPSAKPGVRPNAAHPRARRDSKSSAEPRARRNKLKLAATPRDNRGAKPNRPPNKPKRDANPPVRRDWPNNATPPARPSARLKPARRSRSNAGNKGNKSNRDNRGARNNATLRLATRLRPAFPAARSQARCHGWWSTAIRS